MQPKLKNQTSDLSLDGLEGLLDSAKPGQSVNSDGTANSGEPGSQDWTIEESARALGLSRGAVIRRLEDGILEGYRVKRSYGWVWRVKPSWLRLTRKTIEDEPPKEQEQQAPNPAPAQKNETPDTASAENRDRQEFVEVFDVCEESAGVPALPPASFRELIELKTKLEMTEFQYQDAYKKLESANYRIGYLEARLETSQEQLKMISDSRQNQPWWRRWRQWFSTVDNS